MMCLEQTENCFCLIPRAFAGNVIDTVLSQFDSQNFTR